MSEQDLEGANGGAGRTTVVRGHDDRGSAATGGAAGSGGVVAVVTRGRVEDADVDYAVARISAVLGHVHEPIPFTRLKLTHAEDPARERPAIAHVAIDINGASVRAHVAGHEMREAADLLQQRLRDKLEHRAQHREGRRARTGIHEPGEWRHGDLPTARPSYFDRPSVERQVVRHKTFELGECTPDEVAFDMDQLDYDFHLFRELVSGEDAVLERLGYGTYRLTRLRPTTIDAGPVAIPLEVSALIPPELSVEEATQLLDTEAVEFAFFANATTGRGNVVYRRYDGHYGLITPA